MTNFHDFAIEDIEQALIHVNLPQQLMTCRYQNEELATFLISSGKNGPGEQQNSGCTPRGWHYISDIIGRDQPMNSVFVARVFTGEIYSHSLAQQYPDRDWILSRIIRLKGMEAGRNQGTGVDSFMRYIYIHGTPDSEHLGVPKSHGCIRMHNLDVMKLADWIKVGVKVFIDNHQHILL